MIDQTLTEAELRNALTAAQRRGASSMVSAINEWLAEISASIGKPVKIIMCRQPGERNYAVVADPIKAGRS